MPKCTTSHANKMASSNSSSDSDYIDSSTCRSPPCDDSVIHDLNWGEAPQSPSVEMDIRASPDDNHSPTKAEPLVEFDEDSLVSTDERWTSSVDVKDTDDDLDMNDNGGIWQEVSIKP